MAQEKYGLDPKFEAAVVALLASSQAFWRRLGHAIDPEALDQPAAVLVARAAKAVAAESGDGPASSLIVVQRLRRWHDEGKVTLEQVQAAGAMLDAAEDAGLPPVESAIVELAPVVRKRKRREVVKRAALAYAGGEGWDEIAAEAEAASKIGVAEETSGLGLDDDSAFAAIRAYKSLTHLPTGVPELDSFLDGGIQRRRLGIVMGDTGHGKSTMLNQVCAHTLLGGMNAAYASLELPEDEALTNLVANLVGMPIKELLNGHMPEAQDRIGAMRARLGRFRVRHFTPTTTTVADIRAWVDAMEREQGIEVHLVVVDPLDEIVFAGAGSKDSTYTTQGKATKDLRNWIKESQKWCWATSHVKGGDRRRKVIGLDDVADSRWKVKTPDVVLSLMKDADEQITFNVAKNRGGRSSALIGPLPSGFACGMIVPVARGPVENDEPF
jgi:replicative DNA helicase